MPRRPGAPRQQGDSLPVPRGRFRGGGDCDPNYAGACLQPDASDYDCEGGSGDGSEYTGEVRVVGDDHYDLDRDGDGVACDYLTRTCMGTAAHLGQFAAHLK
jgi:hypothetical protein